jgi:transcriptional regulator with XRE-family HTH domain
MKHRPHPDDREAVEALIDEFTARRVARGVTYRGLADAAGVTKASIWYLECRRPANPIVRTLQTYGGAIELDLHIDLLDMPAVEPSAAVRAFRAGGYLGTATITFLRQIREHRGITRIDIERDHGWRWSSLAGVENTDQEPHVSTIQRFARVLGGRAVPRWEASC